MSCRIRTYGLDPCVYGPWITIDYMSIQKDVGNIGEAIVRLFLMKQGHTIVSHNSLGYGFEIDIVSRNGEGYLFVEVKSVSHETPIDRPLHWWDLALRVGRTAVEGGWRAILANDSGAMKVMGWHINEMSIGNTSTNRTVDEDLLFTASERVDNKKLLHVKRGIEVLEYKGMIPPHVGISFEVITVMLDFFRKTAIIQRIPCEL